jgi:hypothetical protein
VPVGDLLVGVDDDGEEGLGGQDERTPGTPGSEYDHAGTPVRLKVLREVAAEVGATPNQVVLSWLIGGDIPMIPLVGASSVAQLDESLAVDLDLTAVQRARWTPPTPTTGRADPRAARSWLAGGRRGARAPWCGLESPRVVGPVQVMGATAA